MTEAGWLACDNPRVILKNLRDRTTDRKLRLFTVAICRRVFPYIQHEQLRDVTNTVERYADGQATYLEMVGAAKASEWLRNHVDRRERALADAAWCASAMNLWHWKRPLFRTKRVVVHLLAYDSGQARHQTALIRDIFGNPFCPVTFSPSWRTGIAVSLASQMYDSRDFSAMPILADALQDAGCDRADILDHCRGPGPHVRGCWVVDLVLGKE